VKLGRNHDGEVLVVDDQGHGHELRRLDGFDAVLPLLAMLVERRLRALAAPEAVQPASVSGDQAAPIDMVLHCPKCGKQHIDKPNTLVPLVHQESGTVVDELWTNPPHRSHLCHGCGYVWRPADVPTNGVAAVKTKGKADSAPEVATLRAPIPVADPMDWPLPCDVTVGHGTMRKGVSLRALVARMQVLHDMAHEQRDSVAAEEARQAIRAIVSPDAEHFVRMLLWDEFPECCGNPTVGAEYMGVQEQVCCGCPEGALLSNAQIVASLRERFPEANARGIDSPEGVATLGATAKPQEPGPEGARPESAAPPAEARTVDQGAWVRDRRPPDRVQVIAWDGKRIGLATCYAGEWGSLTLDDDPKLWTPIPPLPSAPQGDGDGR
jgi:hypothetical protein